jgi:hypothetical protein
MKRWITTLSILLGIVVIILALIMTFAIQSGHMFGSHNICFQTPTILTDPTQQREEGGRIICSGGIPSGVHSSKQSIPTPQRP